MKKYWLFLFGIGILVPVLGALALWLTPNIVLLNPIFLRHYLVVQNIILVVILSVYIIFLEKLFANLYAFLGYKNKPLSLNNRIVSRGLMLFVTIVQFYFIYYLNVVKPQVALLIALNIFVTCIYASTMKNCFDSFRQYTKTQTKSY